METAIQTPVTLTSSAVKEVKRLMNQADAKGSCLRLGVKGGGCSGMTYILEFDEPQAADEVYDIDGVKVIINPAHGIYLFGMEVDFEDGLNARGFVFHNPNASKTCGCGTSFSV